MALMASARASGPSRPFEFRPLLDPVHACVSQAQCSTNSSRLGRRLRRPVRCAHANRKPANAATSALRPVNYSLSEAHILGLTGIAGDLGKPLGVPCRAALIEERSASLRLQERGPVVVVDNYDSFTYNLCQYLGGLGCEYVVHRNDDVTVQDLERMQPRGILISPGPGTPDESGISLEVVRLLGPQIPLFGVCMGLQCIGQAFGGNIVRAPRGVMHGKTSPVYHNQEDAELGLLAGLSNPFTACRYHSLVIDKSTFPEDQLEVTAWTEDGLVMGVRHKQYQHLEGVQFHPESVMTDFGLAIVFNFLKTIDHFWQ